MKVKKVNKYFFTEWSSEMAYVLGFFLADGTFDITARGGYYFGFHICDKQILLKMKKALGSNHKISQRPVKDNESPRYRLQIGNKKMCEDLLKLGILPQKTKQLNLPKIPSQFIFDFVRGYFDGDGNLWMGYINKNRTNPTLVLQVTFTSGSHMFLDDLRKLLNQNGIKGGSLYVPKEKSFGRLTFSTRSGLELCKYMYAGNSKFFLIRKRKQFDKFNNKYHAIR